MMSKIQSIITLKKNKHHIYCTNHKIKTMLYISNKMYNNQEILYT